MTTNTTAAERQGIRGACPATGRSASVCADQSHAECWKGRGPSEWGYPNFGAATKAHLFKPGREKSACGKHRRDTVIVFSPDTGEHHPHVDCRTCADRSGA